jgi:hypothetical protein
MTSKKEVAKTTTAEGELVEVPQTMPTESTESSAPAPVFRMKKAVTRPVLKFGASPEYVQAESAIYQGEPIPNAKIKELPSLLDVINLRTGEAMVIVCATVLRQELEAAYPGDSIIGKQFQIRKIKTSKDYSLWSIAEIEVL